MPELMAMGFLSSVLIIVLAVLWLRFRYRQLQHQERLAALEKGVAVVPAGGETAPWSPRVYLLRGLIWSFTGAALTIALLAVTAAVETHPRTESAEVLARQAFSLSNNLNIPIDQAREIVNRDAATRAAQGEGTPVALALFGLIPLGVGIAYLVFYRTDVSRQALPPASQS